MAVLRPRPTPPDRHRPVKRKKQEQNMEQSDRTKGGTAALRSRKLKQQEGSPLLRLPVEIQQQIFSHLLAGRVGSVVSKYANPNNSRATRMGFSWNSGDEMSMALLQTCCQVYQDTWDLPLRGNTFKLYPLQTAKQFLRGFFPPTLPSYQTEALRHLMLQYDVGAIAMPDTSHPKRIHMPQLRTLGLVPRFLEAPGEGWLGRVVAHMWDTAFIVFADHADLDVYVSFSKDLGHYEGVMAANLKRMVSCDLTTSPRVQSRYALANGLADSLARSYPSSVALVL